MSFELLLLFQKVNYLIFPNFNNGKAKIDLSQHKWEKSSMAATQSKKVKQYTTDGKYVQPFGGANEAGQLVGVTPSTISGACRGDQKTCKGYKWRYA